MDISEERIASIFRFEGKPSNEPERSRRLAETSTEKAVLFLHITVVYVMTKYR
jgi:hypothetical protein